MIELIHARSIANAVNRLMNSPDYNHLTKASFTAYDHIGAVICDSILQAGLNYSSVVKPRIDFLTQTYQRSKILSGFILDIEEFGLSEMIQWTHETKLNRIYALIDFFADNSIETVSDIYNFYSLKNAESLLLSINGIGAKTIDYMYALSGGNSIAIDRHLKQFAAINSVDELDYKSLKRIYIIAAQLLEIEYTYLDKMVWLYMSRKESKQPEFSFNYFQFENSLQSI